MNRYKMKMPKTSAWIASILVAGIVAWLVFYVANNERIDIINMNEDWNVSLGDESYYDQTLKDIPFSKIKAANQVILEGKIPKLDFEQPVLLLQISNTAFSVYADGNEIYEYGKDEYRDGKLIGSGYHWITLDKNMSGKDVKFMFYSTKASSFVHMDEMKILNSSDVYYYITSENFFTLIVSIFAVVFGTLLLLGLPFVNRIGFSVRGLVSLSAFSIFLGCWLGCNVKVFQLIENQLDVISKIEYMSLYILPVTVSSMLYVMFYSKKCKMLMRVMEIYFLFLAILTFGLQYFDICNLPDNLLLVQISMILAVITVFYCMKKEKSMHSTPADKALRIGVDIFLILCVLEIIRYIMQKYFDVKIFFERNVLPAGLLMLIIGLFVSFEYGIIQRLSVSIEKSTLLRMAYTDSLTQINNRAKCEEILQQYAINKRPVQIINMDLNYFKEANDTYGHAMGDTLLCVFAKLLKEVYDEIGSVGRMGGDEFIVISDPMTEEVFEQSIFKLEQKVQEKNEEGILPYRLSFAHGMATNKEHEGMRPEKVYEQADKAMYYCKRKQEKNRKLKMLGE